MIAPRTAEEAKAIAALKRLAKKWPSSLALLRTGTGSLHVITAESAKEDDIGAASETLAILDIPIEACV